MREIIEKSRHEFVKFAVTDADLNESREKSKRIRIQPSNFRIENVNCVEIIQVRKEVARQLFERIFVQVNAVKVGQV